MIRLFRRTPLTPECAGRMLSIMAAHAKAEQAKTAHGKILARARQICIELGREVPEVLNG